MPPEIVGKFPGPKQKRKRNLIEDDEDADDAVTRDPKKARTEASVELKNSKTTLTEDDILPIIPLRSDILAGTDDNWTFHSIISPSMSLDLRTSRLVGTILSQPNSTRN